MQHLESITIEEILATFRIMDGTYHQEMVDAAIQRRDEIIPGLIAIVREVTADPQRFLETEDRFDHIYAVMLLGHLRAVAAHAAIIDAFSLPEEFLDDLFGDMITEDLPALLLRTCNGALASIRALALNKEVHVFCRISALQALAYAVAEGIAPREEVVTFFGTIFTGAEAEEESDLWTFAAEVLLDLQPREIMPAIEAAYEKGLIDEEMIGLVDFEHALDLNPEIAAERLEDRAARDNLDDLHRNMGQWACFQQYDDFMAPQDPSEMFASGLYGDPNAKAPKKNPKAQKKKKRKQAKASKRKNRK